MNKQQEEKKQENCCCISYKRGITPCMCGCHKMFDAEEENQKLPSEVFMENCEIDVTGWEALLKLLDHLAKKNNWKV